MNFQQLEVQFWEKIKNLGFDSNSRPQSHELFIHICFKIVTEHPGRNRLIREPLKISSKNRFFAFSKANLFRIFENDSNRPAFVSCGS